MSQQLIPLNAVIRQSTRLVSAEMGQEVALMSVENGQYHCLNETSTSIWQMLDQPTTVAEICRKLQDEFSVEAEQCEAEVIPHIQELINEDLVEVIDRVAA